MEIPPEIYGGYQWQTRCEPGRFALRNLGRAFSLVEMMVVMLLMSVIVIGLMAMFGQTQRAYRAGMTQTDVLEAGRAASEMLSRELTGVIPSHRINTTNFYADIPNLANVSVQSLPGVPAGDYRTNALQRLFFLTRENQTWSGYGYLVDATNGVGTLYRYVTSANVSRDPGQLFKNFSALQPGNTNLHRVIDGVVQFRIRAFDTNGVYLVSAFQSKTNITIASSTLAPGEVGLYAFRSNAVPAYVEFELGILEKRAYERFKALPSGPPGNNPQQNYLQNQVGRVHLFRQRVPIRLVDAAAYQ